MVRCDAKQASRFGPSNKTTAVTEWVWQTECRAAVARADGRAKVFHNAIAQAGRNEGGRMSDRSKIRVYCGKIISCVHDLFTRQITRYRPTAHFCRTPVAIKNGDFVKVKVAIEK
jgi:hypothetical protein